MTGTAQTEEKEFRNIYAMDVIVIPTNRPMIRKDLEDAVYKTKKEKYKAVVDEVEKAHEKGQPVLVGTIAIETSELLSKMLTKKGIPHKVLNAKFHELEAEIVADAGIHGSVTIATNMAGRGTDIKLDEETKALGGLKIIGTERHESRRIDNQLRGRSGRQGDPGMSKFFVSLEDDVIKKYGPNWVHKYYKDYTIDEKTESIELVGRRYRRLVEKAQRASDSAARFSRKQTLEYAESMNIQRELIYAQRNHLINQDQDLTDTIEQVLDDYIDIALVEEDLSEKEKLYHFILKNISFHIEKIPDNLDIDDVEAVAELIYQFAYREIDDKKKQLDTIDLFGYFQCLSLLKAIDDNWIEQVDYLQQLQQAIGSQTASQKNPIVEYYQEAFAGFETMKKQIKKDMVRNLLLSQVLVSEDGNIVTYFP